ncbi:MAG: proteasome assembly chaperone (PAC2) family protein [Myxococcota bacterium]|jgi:proteasome assembly chaperone (PAC2) family protein
MYVQPTLQGSTAIFAFEGWNDAGEAATTALGFINDSLRTVPLADIDSETFYDFTVSRPEVVVGANDEREIHWPGNEFRYGAADPKHDLVTCIGVEPHLRWRCFTDCISEVVKSVGARRIVLLGSFLADVIYSQPVQVTGLATDPTLIETLGVRPSTYEGPTGILGVLGDRFTKDGCEVVSLWAGLPHYINARPNPRGALALVQVLSSYLDVPFDMEPLLRSSAEFEERISKLVSRDPELIDYVKQLKRREFAQ